MFNFNTKSLALILSLLIISSLGGYIIYAWTGPTSAPPGSNAPQPLNIGTTDQDKAARISATEFYDADNSSFYINPSGDSSISGILTVGGDISDGSKTIYDSSSGRLDYSVLPYHKGDLTSDWASNVDTSSYYDVSDLDSSVVQYGISFGRGNTGALELRAAPALCASITIYDTYFRCTATPEPGYFCMYYYTEPCRSNVCKVFFNKNQKAVSLTDHPTDSSAFVTLNSDGTMTGGYGTTGRTIRGLLNWVECYW